MEFKFQQHLEIQFHLQVIRRHHTHPKEVVDWELLVLVGLIIWQVEVEDLFIRKQAHQLQQQMLVLVEQVVEQLDILVLVLVGLLLSTLVVVVVLLKETQVSQLLIVEETVVPAS